MASAYVFINTDPSEGPSVQEVLKEVPGVTEVYEVHGVYDIIVRVQAETMERLKDTISTKIKGLSHIRFRLTLIVVE